MTLKTIYKQKKEQDYYSILEITQDATKSEIRSARRKLISKYHPDKHPQEFKDIAMELSSLINESFEALSDEDFRFKYDKSGLTIQYSVSDKPMTITRPKEIINVKGKGLKLTSIVDIDKETLKNGGTVKAVPIAIPGHNIDLSPREIKISSKTKLDSFLIYPGMGEQKENGLNGDLLVMIRCKEKFTPNEKTLVSINPSIPLIAFDKVKQGEQVLEVGELKIPVNKKSKNESLLLIRDVEELDSSLLIRY